MPEYLVSLHYTVVTDDEDEIKRITAEMERQSRESMEIEAAYGGIELDGFVEVLGCGYMELFRDAEED